MKKVLKWLGIVLGSLIGLALIAYLGAYLFWANKAERTYDIEVETFEIPTDAESVARGKILVEAVRCAECHGADLAGVQWIDRPLVAGKFGPTNLTAGENGTADFTDADFIRAIRHAVDEEGKPLIFMPSNFYRELNQRDLGAIIAYINTLPPSEEAGPVVKAGPMIWRLALSEPQGLPAVFMIDHEETTIPIGPAVEETLAYGEYLAFSCKSCHGDDLAGKPILEGLGIPAPNLTPHGIGEWTEDDFFHFLRAGELPDGRLVPSQNMPWEAIGQLPDEELMALWAYLQSVPAIAPEDGVAYQSQ